MAKGMIYSVAAFLTGTLLLGMAILIYSHAQATEIRAIDINLINKVYDTESSLGYSVKNIFQNSAGITTSVDNNVVEFKEDIPNTAASSFASKISSLKSFVENDSKFTTIDNTNISSIPLKINPHNITYTRNSLGGDTVKFIYNGNNSRYSGINITIVSSSNPVSISWINSVSGSLPVRIFARSSSASISDTNNVDVTAMNTANIISDAGVTIASINISKNLVSIQNRLNSSINVDTKLTLINDTAVSISYPGIIRIQINEFNVFSVYDAKIN